MKGMNFLWDFSGIDLVELMNRRLYHQFFGSPLEKTDEFVLKFLLHKEGPTEYLLILEKLHMLTYPLDLLYLIQVKIVKQIHS